MTDKPGRAATSVAVLGTGIMGSAMARNLLTAGLRTTVWDRAPQATAALAEAGAVVAPTAAEAVNGAEVLITMLPTAAVVQSVMFGDGVAQRLTDGGVGAQMGPLGGEAPPGRAARLGQLRPDALFVDAPVSGSKGPAETGQLLVLASGPAEAEGILAPVVDAVGRKKTWLGAAGQGSRMKLVVNSYLCFLVEGVAEALEL